MSKPVIKEVKMETPELQKAYEEGLAKVIANANKFCDKVEQINQKKKGSK